MTIVVRRVIFTSQLWTPRTSPQQINKSETQTETVVGGALMTAHSERHLFHGVRSRGKKRFHVWRRRRPFYASLQPHASPQRLREHATKVAKLAAHGMSGNSTFSLEDHEKSLFGSTLTTMIICRSVN